MEKIYNKLINICKTKESSGTLTGSWCPIILKDDKGCWYKTPFSDWGDTSHIYYNYGDVYKENEHPISFWNYLQSDKEAYNKHIKRVQEFEIYQDCIVLIKYLKLMKDLKICDCLIINEMIHNIVDTKLKLKRMLIEKDFTDTYFLLGVCDTIQYDWCRSDLPELYINKKYHPLLDDIRSDYIDSLYDEDNYIY